MILVVFDIDGTLTDSVKAHQDSFCKSYSSFEIQNLNTDWSSYTHHSDSWIFGEVIRQNFKRDATDKEKSDFAIALNDNFNLYTSKHPISEIPGAKIFINNIKDSAEIGYCLATGSLRDPAIKKLKCLELEYPKDLLVTASEYETREEIVGTAIEKAMGYYGVDEFEHIFSIGDGYWDMKTAEKLKIEFIGIASDEKAKQLKNAGCANLYDNFMNQEITNHIIGRSKLRRST